MGAVMYVLVCEFFKSAMKLFCHGRFGSPLGGIVVDAILVQQPFHVLVVKLFTLNGLQLHGTVLRLFAFQKMTQSIAQGHAPFTLQAHHPGILAQNVNEGQQVACAMVVLGQFRVLHFHQISLSGMIDGGADHRLATGKALTLRAMQGEGGFAAQIGFSGSSRYAQRSGGTQQFFDIAAQGIRTVFVQKQPV